MTFSTWALVSGDNEAPTSFSGGEPDVTMGQFTGAEAFPVAILARFPSESGVSVVMGSYAKQKVSFDEATTWPSKSSSFSYTPENQQSEVLEKIRFPSKPDA